MWGHGRLWFSPRELLPWVCSRINILYCTNYHIFSLPPFSQICCWYNLLMLMPPPCLHPTNWRGKSSSRYTCAYSWSDLFPWCWSTPLSPPYLSSSFFSTPPPSLLSLLLSFLPLSPSLIAQEADYNRRRRGKSWILINGDFLWCTRHWYPRKLICNGSEQLSQERLLIYAGPHWQGTSGVSSTWHCVLVEWILWMKASALSSEECKYI